MYSASYSTLRHCKSDSSDTSTASSSSTVCSKITNKKSKANQTGKDSTHSNVRVTANKTIVIFDWDDTLYPTTEMRTGQADMESLRKLSLVVYQTLNKMIHLYGSSNIFIVSNADKLWIELCLSRLSQAYFVNIYHLIKLHDIEIISAKERFERQFPKNVKKWKQMTFEHLIRMSMDASNDSNDNLSVVCIGDSLNEYNASRRAVRRISNGSNRNVLLHRMKLLQRPSIVQLTEQFELISSICYLFRDQVDSINIDYEKEMHYYLEQKRK